MSRFKAADRGTAHVLPPSVDEWLPQNHLARFVVEVIDQLDLSKLMRQYAVPRVNQDENSASIRMRRTAGEAGERA
jgi:hypothetical protein